MNQDTLKRLISELLRCEGMMLVIDSSVADNYIAIVSSLIWL